VSSKVFHSSNRKRGRIRAAADASFLIGLSLIGQWRLITVMAEKLYVAPAVWEEVFVHGHDKPGAKEIEQSEIIEKYRVKNRSGVTCRGFAKSLKKVGMCAHPFENDPILF
jgi:hypothetical protein